MKNLQSIYKKRAEEFGAQAKQLEGRYNSFSLVRLLIFVVGVGTFIWLVSWGWAWASGFAVLFLLGFARFVRWHLRMQRRKQHLEHLSTINDQELQALDHEYGQFAAGQEFVEPLHPYSYDLDIFGEHSMFQYCNRTSSALGSARLAQYLSTPATKADILARQAASAELKPLLDWRQDFQAEGMDAEDHIHHAKALTNWLQRPTFVKDNTTLQIAMYLNPLWSIIGAVLVIQGYIPWQAGLLFLIPPILILRQYLERINDTHNLTAKASSILGTYAKLIARIEATEFKSERLQGLQRAFKGSPPASASIARLSYIISQLNVRYNAFAIILNVIGLWDLQWMLRLERWQTQQREYLPQWFEALAEFEALASLATLAYNHPHWTTPEISEEPLVYARDLGHPLISPRQMVSNDIDIPTEGHIKLVTGSNMAGKSTFLRTVGLNIVLAVAGAPVCAATFRLPILQVHSSMRTQDALHESTSSFYAELKRLKTIIEAVESQPNIFFLLDEILKGTNSNDRHTGSKALIQQLIRSKGSGIIATHDLELGGLEAQSAGAIENLCMEVEIRDGELDFDYKLKKGVSKSFNATLLMKNMGIKIEE
ncbi:MAG: hypothetical protein AAGG75_06575 [Bacteroidota bacterium]